MGAEWRQLALREAGVQLLDCVHKTPVAAADGYPYIAIPQLQHGRIDLSDVRRISGDDYSTWTKKTKPQAWDVIVSRRCNPGETAVVPPGLECALGQNLVILRSNGNGMYPPFMRWLLRSPAWWEQVQTFINVGAVFDSLKCADIPNFRLPIPPLKEQQAVACILGALDDKIELNRRTSRTLESIARAIFKSWFVDFDPVRAKSQTSRGGAAGRQPTGRAPHLAALFPDAFEKSDLGDIPTGWNIGRLGDAIEIHDSKRIPLSSRQRQERQGPYRYYGAAGIVDYVDDHLFDGIHVLIGEDGSVVTDAGNPIVQYVWGQFWVNNHAHVLKGVNGVCDEQLYLFLQQVNLVPFVTGAVQPKLSQGNMKAIPMVQPPPEVNAAFRQTAEPLFTKLRANHDENGVLAALRDALLPKLISGELRVPDAERIVGRAV
jgi:type I restriction enzyme S subunit